MSCCHAYTLILKLRKYPIIECLHHLKIELVLECVILGPPAIYWMHSITLLSIVVIAIRKTKEFPNSRSASHADYTEYDRKKIKCIGSMTHFPIPEKS